MQTQTSAGLKEEVASLPYLASFFPSLLVIGGNLLGEWFAASNAVFTMGILVIADWLLPADTSASRKAGARLPDVILLLSVALHTFTLGTLIYGIQTGRLTGPFVWMAALSTGINAGSMGIVAAHALVHRREKWLQHLGLWYLVISGNPHLSIEHRLGQQRRGGTWDDPATARFNESYYQFLLRTIPGQWRSALDIEAKGSGRGEITVFTPKLCSPGHRSRRCWDWFCCMYGWGRRCSGPTGVRGRGHETA